MRYIFRNLKSFAKNETLLFCITILCVFCSSIILNFSYGLYQNYHALREEAEMSDEFTGFRPTIREGETMTKGQLQQYVESISTDTMNAVQFVYSSSRDLDGFPSEDCGLFYMRFSMQDGVYQTCHDTRDSWEKDNLIIRGRYISDDEEASGAHVCMIANDSGRGWSDASLNIKNDDGTVTLFGETFEVVGEYNAGSDCPLVPFLTVPDDLEIRDFSLVFLTGDGDGSYITQAQYNELVSIADEVLPGILEYPELDFPDEDTTYLYNNIMLISVLISVLSVINFAMLYLFILKRRGRNLAILRVCGCTKGRVARTYLGECLVLSIPIYVIGAVVYMILLKYVLAGFFPDMEASYSIPVLLIIFLMYLVIMLVILGVLIWRNIRRNIVTVIKEGNV